ncbi:MAG: 2-C-methyl-D-erythritol 4-phosphate cytidylyltransferase [Actinobacteria bacterium]|nr:2-C-methyl-D-erythritol 4-phosphate cytidylyltransferase [Actinomycetota bacterium]
MNSAVIVAGGTGERLGLEGGKQLALIAGHPVLYFALAAFAACESIDEIVVVVHPDRIAEYTATAVDPLVSPKIRAVVGGGMTRQESVLAGLAAISAHADVIIVHDGARPLITPALIARAVRKLLDDDSADGVVVGHPSYDTLKQTDADGVVRLTLDRDVIWAAQTPQAFRADALRAAYDAAGREGFSGTDDASLVERNGGSVRMIAGPRDNIKLTVPEDVALIEGLLAARTEDGARE